MKIGVISDTHGYLDPGVFSVFKNLDLILHAGDIGSEDIITALETLAPVQAVFGNVDGFPFVERYPEVAVVERAGVVIAMTHQFRRLDDPALQHALAEAGHARADVLIYGHSHRAALEERDGVLLFNPGSAGRPRFSLRPAVGLLFLRGGGRFEPRIVYLHRDST